MAAPRDRDVHVIPTPRGGGVAMYLGFAAAVLVASRLPALQRTFDDSQTYAVLVAGGLICLLGVLDDKWGLDALTKLTGQIAAAGVMVLLGVQLAFLFLPVADIGTISLGPQLGVPLTILLTLLTVNALNFIDGLDGLAAGVSAIAALAFFAYSYNLGVVGYDDVASAPALITAVLAGTCLGFLPHNFSPARIFMGDSGSMLVGLMLSAAAVTATGGVDAQTFDSAASLLPLTLPLLVPIAILFIPFVDLVMAVIRRTRRGQSPFSPDKMHLHHRLLVDRPLAPARRARHVLLGRAALLRCGRAVDHRRDGGTARRDRGAARRRRRRRAQPARPPRRPRGARRGAGGPARAQPRRPPDRPGPARERAGRDAGPPPPPRSADPGPVLR